MTSSKKSQKSRNGINSMIPYQFKARNDKPFKAQLNMRIYESALEDLREIPNFHDKIRAAIDEIIREHKKEKNPWHPDL